MRCVAALTPLLIACGAMAGCAGSQPAPHDPAATTSSVAASSPAPTPAPAPVREQDGVDSIAQAEPKQTGPRWCDSMDLLNAARTRMRAAADQRHAGLQVDAAAFAVDQRQAESALADMVAAAPDSVATHLPTVRDYFADNVADIARYVTAGSGPYALLDQIDEPERQALAALEPGLTACRASTP